VGDQAVRRGACEKLSPARCASCDRGALVGGAVTLWLHQRGILLPSPGANVDSIIRPFVPLMYLGRAVAMAAVGAGLAALWPAWRASRLRPVEALAST
jgi:putative ABC transport system permease protein